jgi:hypothetical protein
MLAARTTRRGWLTRDVVILLTLVNYLMVVVGVPLPRALGSGGAFGEVAYPCQGHACGCETSAECWKGDCCCFTLEQKLAWAETKGLEPPAHVRPLLESRKQTGRTHHSSSCCSGTSSTADVPTDSIDQLDRFLNEASSDAERACKACDGTSKDCSHDDSTYRSAESEAKTLSGIRWIVGLFAQKCRGAGPTGLLQLQVTGMPPLSEPEAPQPEPNSWVLPLNSLAFSHPAIPPAPPPRSV